MEDDSRSPGSLCIASRQLAARGNQSHAGEHQPHRVGNLLSDVIWLMFMTGLSHEAHIPLPRFGEGRSACY